MIEKLFASCREVGIVGNKGTCKTSLGLQELLNLKGCGLKRCVFGVEENLKEYLISEGVIILENKEDILDLKIKDAIIYIDEFADLFSVDPKSKQGGRIKRFFNRLEHLNVWVLFSTSQEKFWNSFICGLVKNYLVKEIDYNSLVNGTDLKTKVKGIGNYSDYRLECPKNTFYVIGKGITLKAKFDYNKNLDSKKENFNPFKNLDKNLDKNTEIKNPYNLPSKTADEELKDVTF